jgi:hypothetical protein
VRFVSATNCCPSSRKLGLVYASKPQSSVIEPTQLPSSPESGSTPKKAGNLLQALLDYATLQFILSGSVML